MAFGRSRKEALLLALAIFVPFVLGSNHRTSVRRFKEIRDLVEEEEEEDGSFRSAENEIIDGTPYGQVIDWFVLMGKFSSDVNDRGYCAGSLVTPKVVMTAAHCVDGVNDCPDIVKVGPAFRGPVGVGNVANVVPGSCVLHPLYGRTPNRFDVALFELETEVPNKVVTLNTNPDIPPDNAPVVAYGFGRFSETDGDLSDVLMKMDQTYDQECLDVGTNYLSEFMLCSNNDTAVCTGDSGGPLVYYQDTGTGYDLEIQVGIASYILNRNRCADGTGSDVWTRVSYFAEWVREQIDKIESRTSPPQEEETGGGCAQALISAYESLQSWVGSGIEGISQFFGS